jgi:chorismate mutase
VRRAAEQEFAARFRDDLWGTLLFWCKKRNVICQTKWGSRCARVFQRAPTPEDVPATATHGQPPCDEWGEMWAFLVKESTKRAQRYRGPEPLCHFLLTMLHGKWMYDDYVRHHLGRVEIPKVLKDASPEVQDVYRYLRWGYGDEDLALRLAVPVEEARRLRTDVEGRLKQAVQKLRNGRSQDEESLSSADEEESSEIEVVDEAQPDIHTQVLIQNIRAALRQIIARLPPLDQEVLDGLYRRGQTAREITAAWQKAGRSFEPGQPVTQNRIETSVRRSMRTIVRELPTELAYFGPEEDMKQSLAQQDAVKAIKEYLPAILSDG